MRLGNNRLRRRIRLLPSLMFVAFALVLPSTASAVTPNIAFTNPTSTGVTNSHQGNISAYGPAVAFTATCQISNNSFNSDPLNCGYADYWVSIGITMLVEGSHTITVVATATDGSNAKKTITRDFTTDWTAPQTYLTSGPYSESTSDSTPSWDFDGSDANGIGSYECNLDDAGWSACTSPYTASSLADGAHTFQVRAIDNATNVDASPESASFTVDTQAPTVGFAAKPALHTAGDAATFEYASDEGATTYFCELDGDNHYPCPTSFSGLAAGSHTLDLYGVDAAENESSSPITWTWTNYPSPPETNNTGAPDSATAVQTAEFSFTSADGNTFECSLDGAVWAACTSPYSVTGLAAGQHTFGARAIDPSGQADPTPLALSFTIAGSATDTTKPKLSKFSLGASYFKLRISEAGKVTVKIATCAKKSGSKRAKCKTVRSIKGSAKAGKTLKLKIKKRLKRGVRYKLTIVATDKAGNRKTVTKSFKLK